MARKTFKKLQTVADLHHFATVCNHYHLTTGMVTHSY